MSNQINPIYRGKEYQLTEEQLKAIPMHQGARFMCEVDSEAGKVIFPVTVVRVINGWIYNFETLKQSCFVPYVQEQPTTFLHEPVNPR